MNLYILTKIHDNSKFEGFALDYADSILGRDSLDDDINPAYGNDRYLNQPKLSSKWFPPGVEGKVSQLNDYPCIDLSYPAFSKNAISKLSPFLKKNGEILPLQNDSDPSYFFYNVTTIIDCLDLDRSEAGWIRLDPPVASSFERVTFKEECLSESDYIFRVPEWPNAVIVNEKFMEESKKAKLKGMEFTRVWPFDTSQYWKNVNEKVTLD